MFLLLIWSFTLAPYSAYFLAPFATGKGSLFVYFDSTSYNTDSVALMIRRNLDWPIKQAAIRR